VGIAADGSGNLFVASHGRNQISRVVIATGEVSVLAGQPLDYQGGFADGIGTAAGSKALPDSLWTVQERLGGGYMEPEDP